MQNFSDPVQGGIFKFGVKWRAVRKCAFFNEKLAISQKR